MLFWPHYIPSLLILLLTSLDDELRAEGSRPDGIRELSALMLVHTSTLSLYILLEIKFLKRI